MDALEFDLQKKTSETDLIISAWESEKKSLQNNICDLQMELDDERAKNEQVHKGHFIFILSLLFWLR